LATENQASPLVDNGKGGTTLRRVPGNKEKGWVFTKKGDNVIISTYSSAWGIKGNKKRKGGRYGKEGSKRKGNPSNNPWDQN